MTMIIVSREAIVGDMYGTVEQNGVSVTVRDIPKVFPLDFRFKLKYGYSYPIMGFTGSARQFLRFRQKLSTLVGTDDEVSIDVLERMRGEFTTDVLEVIIPTRSGAVSITYGHGRAGRLFWHTGRMIGFGHDYVNLTTKHPVRDYNTWEDIIIKAVDHDVLPGTECMFIPYSTQQPEHVIL